ncbi:MAG: hypothetical protein ACLQPD_30835 [Desulfomonilaceae bacterium]
MSDSQSQREITPKSLEAEEIVSLKPSQPGKWRNSIIPLVFLAVGLLVAFWPTITSQMALMQTDPGDTRFNNYILEHGYRWVMGDALHKSFWDPPFFWPERNVAAYSDISLGTAPLYWSFRLIGIMPDTSFQLWMILVVALNYVGMFVLLRWGMRLSILASTGGAYVFAFGAPRVAQLGHQALLPHFFSVLAILCLIKYLERSSDFKSGRRATTALCFGCIVFQVYAGFYLGWFLAFGLTVFVLFSIAHQQSRKKLFEFLTTDRWFIVGCLISSLMAISWMGYHYFFASVETGGRPWVEVSRMIPRVSSWFYMGDGQLLYGWLYKYTNIPSLPMANEHAMGVGLLTLALCCYGLWAHWRNHWIRILVYSTVCIGLLALMYPFEFSPWKFVWKFFPGASAIRAVSRICLLLLIPLAIGVGLGLNRIRRLSIALLLLVLICVEQAYTTHYYDKLISRAQVNEIAKQIGDNCSAFYYVKGVEPGQEAEPVWKCQIDAMWAQMQVSKPTLNGYSGKSPPAWRLWQNIVTTREELSNIKRNVESWARVHELKTNEVCLTILGAESVLPSKTHSMTTSPFLAISQITDCQGDFLKSATHFLKFNYFRK